MHALDATLLCQIHLDHVPLLAKNSERSDVDTGTMRAASTAPATTGNAILAVRLGLLKTRDWLAFQRSRDQTYTTMDYSQSNKN